MPVGRPPRRIAPRFGNHRRLCLGTKLAQHIEFGVQRLRSKPRATLR